MNTIYIDLDEVVAGFSEHVSKILGRTVLWTDRSISPEEWKLIAAEYRLYYNLPLMEGATTLVGYCKGITPKYNVEFLTAIPRKDTVPYAMEDKKEWVAKYFPGFVVNFGPFSTDKWKWCRPGDILIDDKYSNIVDWHEKGNGIAIMHKGYIMDTIDILDKVIGCKEPKIFT